MILFSALGFLCLTLSYFFWIHHMLTTLNMIWIVSCKMYYDPALQASQILTLPSSTFLVFNYSCCSDQIKLALGSLLYHTFSLE